MKQINGQIVNSPSRSKISQKITQSFLDLEGELNKKSLTTAAVKIFFIFRPILKKQVVLTYP
jgi:hypothetical protein